MSNYQLLLKQISKCNKKEDFDRVDSSVTRLYEADQITEKEAGRLFIKIMERLCAIGCHE